MYWLFKPLPPKVFIISQVLILLAGLLFLAGLHFVVNIQDQEGAKNLVRGPVTTEPVSLKLDLFSPDDNLLVFHPIVEVSGQAAPHLPVLISSQKEDQVVTTKANGQFSTLFNLLPGVNEITIVVFDKDGEKRQLIRTIYYSKEKL